MATPTVGERLQGDIYHLAPSVRVGARPVRAARYFRQASAGRHLWSIHEEGGQAPADGFKWASGEQVLVPGRLGMAIVLSHDCEIENAPNCLVVARVRPMTDLEPRFRQACRDFNRWDTFPLFPQAAQPSLDESFIDFAELTTVDLAGLPIETRHARVSEEIRNAIARAFWNYLFHPLQQRRESDE